MQEIRLSIIIPHYNSPNALKRLLSTIPALEEIQVIVVDDFSDKKLEEYEECKVCYSYVEFYTNESKKSAGAARNTGLKYARGEWLLFADADDYFLPDFYSKVAMYLESDYDIVYFTPTSMNLQTKEIATRHLSYERIINRYVDTPSLKNLLGLKYSFVSPWSKLVKRSIFVENEIIYDEIMFSNDVMASIKSAYYAEQVKVSEDVIYCITQNGSSLTANITREKYNIRLDVYFRRIEFLRNNLSSKEWKLINCKVKDYMQQIVDNNFGWGFYIKTFVRIVLHGIPFWREYGPYSRVWKKME